MSFEVLSDLKYTADNFTEELWGRKKTISLNRPPCNFYISQII